MTNFKYAPMFQLGPDTTEYYKIPGSEKLVKTNKFGDKTILEVIMDQFEGIGCKKFYMSVNYKSDMMRYYLDQLDHHYNIEFFEETKPLGTIGSVSLLKGKITTPFFVSQTFVVLLISSWISADVGMRHLPPQLSEA